ncbi:DUF1629 domain-containing protein [Breznakia sp. PFB1-11]|uniref:imm11 family protein n=1 Tax=unclassified Breznakia TaxID=2623764 RepID=UPI0032AF598A
MQEGKLISDWPTVKFYYSSKASDLESEYLLNSWRWPIIHKKVRKVFEGCGFKGIQYLPIRLIDVVTNKLNEDYVVMNVLNYIDAYDMSMSNFSYNEKYNMYIFVPNAIFLDTKTCSSYDIFRADKNSVPIYISEKVKDIIIEHDWIGFEFYPQKSN